MTELKNRYDLVLMFDCTDGNPNGDPDAGNMPRTDPQTQQGLVSDVCLKRKVRDWVYQRHVSEGQPGDGYDIFFGHSGLPERQILNRQIAEAHLSLLDEKQRAEYDKKFVEKANKKEKDEYAFLKKVNEGRVGDVQAYLCQSRFDIRTFGAVLSTGPNAGQVRGPVQCTFARSIDPVFLQDLAITRKSVATEEDAAKQMGKDNSITGTIGRKTMIPYGFFRNHWFVSPSLAERTGFTEADFKVLCDALLNMFEIDRSASRGFMATRRLFVFRHDSKFGNAPAHALFDRIQVTRAEGGLPARSAGDYQVAVDAADLPAGVSLFDLSDPAAYRDLFGA
ncbi:type I-C CRISPR-associated protein Cas7/Csd2 [Acanthopleuribacter pedis]|uniref:Type I-C CRISPR-associated protein Cas7/Csd2 n=1 Tax=Acanthopleuribacter pedis TaxID=442870 RepID=A0A8J7QG69_9BACT|nr:type I-C CRISPR-associated protein Cas7/Csd2 [Acanthopleuribacter pedis]MBO1319445.1 type I-C CRISPR-associated protein Cas7/Csd2 [Acanthopleuribacter pedis]